VTADTSGYGPLTASTPQFNPVKMVYLVYIGVTSFFIFRLLLDILNLLLLISRQGDHENRIVKFRRFATAGFSAMGYIFINARLNSEDSESVIRHEKNHLSNYHFCDILLIEIVKSFQWFNPFIHLLNRSLRAIHEFQADEECISSGVSLVKYQNLLLSQVFRSGIFTLSNSFSNPSLIKKRMMMMTKDRTPISANIKLLLVIPVTGLVFLAISACKDNINPVIADDEPITETGQQATVSRTTEREAEPEEQFLAEAGQVDVATNNQNTPEEEQEPFIIVEDMPSFPGGMDALLTYVSENINYPEKAKENNIQGRVVVRFCITPTGSISRPEIYNSIDPELDAEAIRVINSLPEFIPGKQGGVPVPVWFILPITFTLK
jgi:TonB family protein